MDTRFGYVYILATYKYGTLYTGVTSDLKRRIIEHKSKILKSFTERYNVSTLVYFEQCDSIVSTIAREKQIKNWKRIWKVELIERNNPDWLEVEL